MKIDVYLDKIKSIIDNNSFINLYIKGKNIPLDFSSIETDVEFLANGEYNANYLLKIKIVYNEYDECKVINDKIVLRINFGSQISLFNQIEYEFNALKILENSNVTPKPIFLDTSKKILDKDYLVMQFYDGDPLDYEKDIFKAAESLVKIHKLEIPLESKLLNPTNPNDNITDESIKMYSKYEKSNLYDESIGSKIEYFMEKVLSKYNDKSYDTCEVNKCIVNTELNSSNFIIHKQSCIVIDWEKPIISEKEQDLGHFLAPTTTFWKTNHILSKDEIDRFLIYYYIRYNSIEENLSYRNNEIILDKDIENRIILSKDFIHFKDKVYSYIILNCLRGITWCAMAWVEYNSSEKDIINEFTYNKLKAYLSEDFLKNILSLI